MGSKTPISTIVCLGDSITCNWDEPKYPEYWQQLLDQSHWSAKVINAGINGETAQDGYYRLPLLVRDHQPSLVTVMFGHNEFLQNQPADQLLNYLAKIINWVTHESKADVWLLTPNKIGNPKLHPLYQPYLQAIKSIATEKSTPLIDIWDSFKDEDLSSYYTHTFPYLNAPEIDIIHPNQKGQKLIASTLMEFYGKIKLVQ